MKFPAICRPLGSAMLLLTAWRCEAPLLACVPSSYFRALSVSVHRMKIGTNSF
jgi:hypothetical protein